MEFEFHSKFCWNHLINLAGPSAKFDSSGIPGIAWIPPDSGWNQWRTIKTSKHNPTSGLVAVDDDVGVDDTDVTIEALPESVAGRGIPEGFILTEEGGMSLNANAEGLDKDDVTIVQGIGGDVEDDKTQRGHGKH